MFIGLVVLRLALVVLLPVVLRKTASSYDLRSRCERIDLSLLGGDAGIWGLELTARAQGRACAGGGAAACHQLGVRARSRVSPLALFIGQLHIYRVECDARADAGGAGCGWADPAAGTICLAAAPAKPSKKKTSIDLTSPLRMDALRVEHLRLHARDLAVSPALDAQIGMELRITDLGSRTRPARWSSRPSPVRWSIACP